MKGVSLSIETVILVILAAIVVAVLLAFLMGVINPADSEIKLLQKQNEACSGIAQIDPRCHFANPTIAGIVNDKLLSGNNPPCNSERPNCNPGTLNNIESCIQTCCRLYCAYG